MRPASALLAPLLLALAPLAAAAPQLGETPFARALAFAERELGRGNLEESRRHLDRALERDPRSVAAWELRARWAEASGDRDEQLYSRHVEYRLAVAQGLGGDAREEMAEALIALDPLAEELFDLQAGFVKKLEKLAVSYEEDGRPHSAIRVHKQVLALDPEHAPSEEAIQRIASAPDPSLAADAKPRDLLADVSEEWIRAFDAEHATWDSRAERETDNYRTFTDAGYEVLVRASEAMEQMNAFYRVFFAYGTEEDGGSVPKIDLNIFRTRDEYLELGIGPPVSWSGGHFTGGAVETYIGAGGFEETTGTLFHEAAHQFVALATRSAGWLNEGLASFFEGCRILSNGTVLMNLPANHRLFPLVDRMEQGWMDGPWDGIDPDDPSAGSPTKAPTFRIVLENEYPWGPPWYAPTWGVVFFLYNFQDPVDGRFVYRDAFRVFIDKSGGRMGEGAVENFEEIVLGNPKPPTKGVDFSKAEDRIRLPETVEELNDVWKDWMVSLRQEATGQISVERPYLDWARYAEARGDLLDAKEHYEKGLVEHPDDADLLEGFAELLAEEFDDEDRASKLLLRALQVLEAVAADATPDQDRIDAIEKRLGRLDPERRSLARLHDELSAVTTGLVQRYLAEGSHLQAMDLAWRMGSDLKVEGMFAFFEEAARRGGRSLAMWRLAYNEENLEGWQSAGNDTFTAQREALVSEFSSDEANAFRFLVLDEVTSGDFSMEAEISAVHGQVNFCGLVFGRKTANDFHAAILYPPGQDAGGRDKAGFIDLTSFYGGGTYDVWRHSPIPAEPERDADRSISETWRRLRVDVTGRVVDVWLDDRFIATHEFGSLAVLRGSFGLITGEGLAKYRNVRYLAREPNDPGSAIERDIRMGDALDERGARGTSWLGVKPPFPEVERWAQGERSSWEEAGAAPQLLVLWSLEQNNLIPLDPWLTWVAAEAEKYGLRIVSIVSAWDDAKVDAYLAEHSFPDAVGVDRVQPGERFGVTFSDYFIAEVNVPRLVLLDIDGTVAWEGDPGFRIGEPWKDAEPSYMDSAFFDLVQRRRIVDRARWREAWNETALPALADGDLGTAWPLLEESLTFDWRHDDTVLAAQTRLRTLQAAAASLVTTAEQFEEAQREPALDTLLAWAELIGAEVDKDTTKELRRFGRAARAKAWTRALGYLSPVRKRLEGGKDPSSALDSAIERIEGLEGPFPAELAEALGAAAGDAEAVARAVEEAPRLPGRWLAREHFGW